MIVLEKLAFKGKKVGEIFLIMEEEPDYYAYKIVGAGFKKAFLQDKPFTIEKTDILHQDAITYYNEVLKIISAIMAKLEAGKSEGTSQLYQEIQSIKSKYLKNKKNRIKPDVKRVA